MPRFAKKTYKKKDYIDVLASSPAIQMLNEADEVRATFWKEAVKDKDLIKFISNDLKKRDCSGHD